MIYHHSFFNHHTSFGYHTPYVPYSPYLSHLYNLTLNIIVLLLKIEHAIHINVFSFLPQVSEIHNVEDSDWSMGESYCWDY